MSSFVCCINYLVLVSILQDPALQFGAGVVEIGTNFQIHLTEEPMSEQVTLFNNTHSSIPAFILSFIHLLFGITQSQVKQAIARGAGVDSIQVRSVAVSVRVNKYS